MTDLFQEERCPYCQERMIPLDTTIDDGETYCVMCPHCYHILEEGDEE